VAYEIGTNIDATCFGGIAAVHRLVTRLGLPEQINDRLRLLKVHLPYHESDHVLNLAYNVVCGGTRLEDIEWLRHDSAYLNAVGADLIPDPTTAGDFCRRFTEADAAALMEAINAVRPKLWTSRGRELLAPVAYVDVDGSIAATGGQCKQGVDMSYKGIWGYAPLVVSLANTREVLYVVNRPGNAPSHQDAAGWIDKAIDLVAPHTPRVSAWRHRLQPDRALRPVGQAGGLHLRHGRQRTAAAAGRGPGPRAVAAAAPTRPVPEHHRHHPGASAQPQAAHRPRARLPQPEPGPRGRRRVLLHPRQVFPRLPDRRGP
jgi:Transposase DDE domain group 1